MRAVVGVFSALLSLVTVFASKSSWLDFVELVGRTHVTNEGSIQSDWPNTGLHFQFQATDTSSTIQISFANCQSSCHSFVAVEVNCDRVGKFEVNSSHLTIEQSLLTTPGERYDIVVRKVTEASCGDAYGVLETVSVNVKGGDLVALKDFQPICAKKTQLLVFGDSFTAAYGVDQLSPCAFSAATEDVTHGYATTATSTKSRSTLSHPITTALSEDSLLLTPTPTTGSRRTTSLQWCW